MADTTQVPAERIDWRVPGSSVPMIRHAVDCPFGRGGCGAQTEWYATAAEAIAAWNRRTPPKVAPTPSPLHGETGCAYGYECGCASCVSGASSTVRERVAAKIGTHWDGCWRDHHECAIARIEERAADTERLDWMEAQRTRDIVFRMESSGWRAYKDSEDGQRPIAPFGRTLRDAIDAARTGGAE